MNVQEYAQSILNNHNLNSSVCVATDMSLEFLRELSLTMAWEANTDTMSTYNNLLVIGTGRGDYTNKGDYFLAIIERCFTIAYAKNNNLISEEMIVHERHLPYRRNRISTLEPELRNRTDINRDGRNIVLFGSPSYIFNDSNDIEFNQNPVLYL